MSNLVSLLQKNDEYLLTGRLDRDTVPLFWQTRNSWIPNDEHIVVDLSGLERIDSAGMAMLLHFKHIILAKAHTIVFNNVPPQLATLMQLSNVKDFLNR